MEFDKFIKENEEVVISKNIDNYLRKIGFIFILDGFTGKYYKLISYKRRTFKIEITSHGQIFLSEIGNTSNNLNILKRFKDTMSDKAMLEGVELEEVFITRELFNSKEFINTLTCAMENFSKDER